MPAALPDFFKSLQDCAHVAVAVSGGSDSTCLMHYAHRWALERGGRPRLTVLTVDHGLRPDAATEARQVAKWAGKLGIDHVTLHWMGNKPATGIQAAARQARYDLMTGWCKANGAEALLTGHTRDDQAETVLMRMGRTSSLDSLAGIAPEGCWNGTRLVRPLLGLDREQLRGYLRIKGHAWIDDPSNEDDRFERVRIRTALTNLRTFGIDRRRLADLADECREAADVLGAMADAHVAEYVTVHPRGFATFPTDAFLGLPLPVRLRVLRRLLPGIGSGKLPLRSEIAQLAEALERPGCKQTLGGAVIWRRAREILMAREAGRIADGVVTVPAERKVIWDGRFEIVAPPGFTVLPGRDAPPQPRVDGVPRLVQDAEPVVLDLAGQPVAVDFTGNASVSARFLSLKSP